MPPRRPPPLLPKSRLIEAINVAPVDSRLQPLRIFDSRVEILRRSGSIIESLPTPWVHTAGVDGGPAPRTFKAFKGCSELPVSGCTYYATEEQIDVLLRSMSTQSGPDNGEPLCFIVTATAATLASLPFRTRDLPNACHVIGTTESTHILKEAASFKTQHGEAATSLDTERILVLELAPEHSPVPLPTLANLVDVLLPQQSQTSASRYRQAKLVIGNMGNPDLGSIGEEQRLFIDGYEKTISALALVPNVFWQFSGYLSLLPQTKVTSAYMELVEDSSTGGDAYKWCRKALSAYFSIVLEAFGEERIIWGSGLNLPDDTEAMLQEQNVKADHMWLFSLKLALDVTRDIGMRGPSLDKIFCTNAERLAS